MTTLQITVDENIAAAIRRRAELDGKSSEAWLAEVVTEKAMAHDKAWIDEFLQSGKQSSDDWLDEYVKIAREARGNSHGWKWNREELYDE